MTTKATKHIAHERGLSTKYLDRLHTPGSNKCPGFNLYEVTVGEDRYLMAADDAAGVGTRLYFRAGIDDAKTQVTIERIGPNPDVEEWEHLN